MTQTREFVTVVRFDGDSVPSINQRVYIGIGDDPESYYSTYFASISHDVLHVAAPIKEQKLMMPRPGDEVNLSYRSDKVPYRATVRVIEVITQPSEIIVVKRPTEVLRVQRRRFFRLPVDMEVAFCPLQEDVFEAISTDIVGRLKDGWTWQDLARDLRDVGIRSVIAGDVWIPEVHTAITDDVSAGGAGVLTATQFVEGSYLTLKVTFQEGCSYLVTGIVRRCDETIFQSRSAHRLAIEFVHDNPQLTDELVKEVLRLQRHVQLGG